jgi:hypothetical protein
MPGIFTREHCVIYLKTESSGPSMPGRQQFTQPPTECHQTELSAKSKLTINIPLEKTYIFHINTKTREVMKRRVTVTQQQVHNDNYATEHTITLM